ncbi:MAG: hypothetical protein HYU36_01435 [Planctomycetes bacterium]|nr:hypothetical protein [Planctomycetota bacterium]
MPDSQPQPSNHTFWVFLIMAIAVLVSGGYVLYDALVGSPAKGGSGRRVARTGPIVQCWLLVQPNRKGSGRE